MEKTYEAACPHCGFQFPITIRNPDEPKHMIVGKQVNLGSLAVVNDVTDNTNLVNEARKRAEIRSWLETEKRKILNTSEGYSNLKSLNEGMDGAVAEQIKEDQRKSGFV